MRLQASLAVIALTLTAHAARAETLGESTATALGFSPALQGEMQRVEATREALPIAWAEVFPQVTLDASATDARSTESGLAFSVRQQREHWIAGIRTSTLLYGGGRLGASRRQARAQIAEAVARYQERMQSFILDVTRAYGDVRQEQATLDAQEQAVANFTEQRRYVASHVRNGFLTLTDLAQADSRLANARADLATANARLVAANEAYLRLVGHAPGALSAPIALRGMPATLGQAHELAARESPTITAQMAAYEASDAAVALAAAQGRFNVSLETSDAALSAIDPRPTDGEESEDSVSLRVSVPLFSGGGIRARERQQRHLRRAERYDLDETRNVVRERVTVAWANLAAARARIEATQARVEAAEAANEGVRREQEVGQRTTIDVLDQENELLQARISLAQAERQAMVAERELAASLGSVDELARQGGQQ
jgi:outer membrane protein